MDGKWGMPYRGSKNTIAKEILCTLPEGKRFVDLFGGGFAMSHCCLVNFCGGLFPKYESVLYNDHNPLLKLLIKKAIDGFYNYDSFKPEWVSKERFLAEKEGDAYIKWVWSFGNSGDRYIFGKNIEELKRQAHQLVVFGEVNELTKDVVLKGTDIKTRRLEWMAYCRSQKKRCDLEQLERLERIQQLERLERLERLELTAIDYHDYEYRDGDVVYCDIPYELSTEVCYGSAFDFKEFRRWVKSRNYRVYVSSYIDAPVVWQRSKLVTMSRWSNNSTRQECLFCYN